MKRYIEIGAFVLGIAVFAGFLAMLSVRTYRKAPDAAAPAQRDGGQTGIVASDYDRLATLTAILDSKNDNDPRLDTAFYNLTAGEKKLFRRQYAKIPPERRNERGTIVYLLGKNAKDPADWSFLAEAAAEPACLSLDDCSKKGSGGAGIGDDVTLAYPALVALKSAQTALAKDPADRNARGVIEAARTSKAPAVQRMVGRLDRQLPK